MRAIITATLILFSSLAAAETPMLIGRVNDHAGVLTPAQRNALADRLEAIERAEGKPQVVVLLPKSMDGADIERFTNDTFRAWKLGQAGKDNGVLIVIAPAERKWRIEVGYGLEGVLPDGRAKAILSNDMDPHLKGGKAGFYAALDAAVTSIAADIAKEKPASVAPANDGSVAIIVAIVIICGLGALLFFVISSHYRRREEDQDEREQAEATLHRSRMFRDNSFVSNRPVAAATTGAIIGGGVGAAAASASLAAAHRERERVRRDAERRRRDDDYRSRSSSYDSGSSYSSGSSSSWSSSSDSSSNSFSSGGGDSGGGGASSGD